MIPVVASQRQGIAYRRIHNISIFRHLDHDHRGYVGSFSSIKVQVHATEVPGWSEIKLMGTITSFYGWPGIMVLHSVYTTFKFSYSSPH